MAGVVDAETLLGGQVPRLDMLMRVAARLRWGRYDGAIVLERSLWLGLLSLVAGIPVRVGLDSGGRGFAHTIGVPVEEVRQAPGAIAEDGLGVLGGAGLVAAPQVAVGQAVEEEEGRH